MILQLTFVLTAIIIGARLGGIGLGVMGGVGLAILTFVFGLQPTAPPIDVMLMIAAVISAAACMQAAGGARLHGKAGRTFATKKSVTRHSVKSAGDLSVYFRGRNRTCGLLRIARDSGSCH